MTWLILAIIPARMSCFMASTGLILRSSASSLTVREGGNSTDFFAPGSRGLSSLTRPIGPPSMFHELRHGLGTYLCPQGKAQPINLDALPALEAGAKIRPPPRLLPRGVHLHTPVHPLHNTDQPPFIPDLPAGDTGALGDGPSCTSHGLSVPRSSSSSTDSALTRRGFLGRLLSSFSFFFFFSTVVREERISSAKRMGPLSGATTTGKTISWAATSGGASAGATSVASRRTPSTAGAASAA